MKHIQLIEKEAWKFYPETPKDKEALRRIIPSLFDNKAWIDDNQYTFVLNAAANRGIELRTQPLLMEVE